MKPRLSPSRVLSIPLLATLILWPVVLGGASCGANPPGPDDPQDEGEATPYVPPAYPDRDPPGYFLTKVDELIRVWTTQSLNARTPEDRLLVDALAKQINQETWKHRADLIATVTGGPPRQREVAAAALGFVAEPEVLSPLMNALSDPEPAVVEKALFGLGVLAAEATPVEPILFHLKSNPNPTARINAAYALYRLMVVTGGTEQVAAGCREALRDEEWAVQTQCAGILGRIGGPAAIDPLGKVLLATGSTPCQSAAVALCRIATRHGDERGRVARLLVDSLPRIEPTHQRLLLEPLTVLSEEDFGQDWNAWRSWAYALD